MGLVMCKLLFTSLATVSPHTNHRPSNAEVHQAVLDIDTWGIGGKTLTAPAWQETSVEKLIGSLLSWRLAQEALPKAFPRRNWDAPAR